MINTSDLEFITQWLNLLMLSKYNVRNTSQDLIMLNYGENQDFGIRNVIFC